MAKNYRSKMAKDFKREAQKANWHFEWVTKSSLRPILLVLDEVPDPPMGLPPSLTHHQQSSLAAAIRRLSRPKREKYKNALAWLKRMIPALDKSIVTGEQPYTVYSPGREVRQKDVDGHWHRFYLQQKHMSCGPTCVRTVMLAITHIPTPPELEIRNSMGLVMEDNAHTGISTSTYDWDIVGTNTGGKAILQALWSHGVRDARAVKGVENIRRELGNVTTHTRAIMGWLWGNQWGDGGNGGHWTTCVGKTNDGQHFKLLDPWTGIEYIDATDFWEYWPQGGGGGAYGWMNPSTGTPAVIVTHPR